LNSVGLIDNDQWHLVFQPVSNITTSTGLVSGKGKFRPSSPLQNRHT